MSKTESRNSKNKGFALIITLSLMVLLALIAIGILSLSSVTLRSTQSDQAMARARNNARMALMLALGDLQRQLGPDQRISTPMDTQINGSNAQLKHYTGVYDSWKMTGNRPMKPDTDYPTPVFHQWLMSGRPSELTNPGQLPSTGNKITLVSADSVGMASGEVSAPSLATRDSQGNISGEMAWWVNDLGTKGFIHGEKEKPVGNDYTKIMAEGQTMPVSAPSIVKIGAERPFESINSDNPKLSSLASQETLNVLAESAGGIQKAIHDVTTYNRGLLTNVRTGGLRKDFSMYLETTNPSPKMDVLTKVNNKDAHTMDEIEAYYNLFRQLKKNKGSFAYTTSGSIPANAAYQQMPENASAAKSDSSYHYKQPNIIRTQVVLSLYGKPAKQGEVDGIYLQVVVDPIVTFWNPYDVPLVMTPGSNSITFWQLPYNFLIRYGVGGFSIPSFYEAVGRHYTTMMYGVKTPMILKPGEVLMMSQGANTAPTEAGKGHIYAHAEPGWNFGGGVAYTLKSISGDDVFISGDDSTEVTYNIKPNDRVSDGTNVYSVNHHSIWYGDHSTNNDAIRFGISGINVDKTLKADQNPAVFDKIPNSAVRVLTLGQLRARKEPVMLYSYSAKSEYSAKTNAGAGLPSRYISHLSPQLMGRKFKTFSPKELQVMPIEIQVEPLNSWKNDLMDVSEDGNGYYGGGYGKQDGNSIIITHSIPRHPVYSLGSLQHAVMNGFKKNRLVASSRDPIWPEISHAIGNSYAPPSLPSDKIEGSFDSRDLADHSYLLNEALWDDWFFSGISPEDTDFFIEKRNQREVARQFFAGDGELPLQRYRPELNGLSGEEALTELFGSGSKPVNDAYTKSAQYIEADGMFNVNSNSVEAWKMLLSAHRQRSTVVRNAAGAELVKGHGNTPVSSLAVANDDNANEIGSVVDSAQWGGYRTLTDDQIQELAEAIANEVQRRGPFLSLADFVNRRPSNNKNVALSGVIQTALDSNNVSINEDYRKSDRLITGNSGSLDFPDAESGIAATGIPGVVSQADILTPIAPYLSARSDSFLIRTCGRALDNNNKVLATVYCEAIVQRGTNFVDEADIPTDTHAQLNTVNKRFGRQFKIVSFRWLNAEEI